LKVKTIEKGEKNVFDELERDMHPGFRRAREVFFG
jgi:hypothetical protein